MKHIIFVIALLCSVHALADEASRKLKLEQLVQVTGVQKMFQQQIDQAKLDAPEIGKKMLTQIFKDVGAKVSQIPAPVENIMNKYVERMSSIFTAKEHAEIWINSYGKNLSETDLDTILAFYQSPIGQREIDATQTALTEYSKIVNLETQNRMSSVISEMMTELKALNPK